MRLFPASDNLRALYNRWFRNNFKKQKTKTGAPHPVAPTVHRMKFGRAYHQYVELVDLFVSA